MPLRPASSRPLPARGPGCQSWWGRRCGARHPPIANARRAAAAEVDWAQVWILSLLCVGASCSSAAACSPSATGCGPGGGAGLARPSASSARSGALLQPWLGWGGGGGGR